jgi:serine/threonine protein kinase
MVAFIAQSMDGLLSRIRRARFDQRFPSNIPAELQKLVCSMLSADPSQRPTTRDLAVHPSLKDYCLTSELSSMSMVSMAELPTVRAGRRLHSHGSGHLRTADASPTNSPSSSPKLSAAAAVQAANRDRLQQLQGKARFNGADVLKALGSTPGASPRLRRRGSEPLIHPPAGIAQRGDSRASPLSKPRRSSVPSWDLPSETESVRPRQAAPVRRGSKPLIGIADLAKLYG